MIPDLRALELETAKEMLGEQFDADPNEVDDMIRQRMDGSCFTIKSSVYPLPDSQLPIS